MMGDEFEPIDDSAPLPFADESVATTALETPNPQVAESLSGSDSQDPNPPHRPRPWLTLVSAVVVGIAFVTAQLLALIGVAVYLAVKNPHLDVPRWMVANPFNGTIVSIGEIAGVLAAVPLILAFGRMLGRGTMDESLGLRRARLTDMAKWTLVMVAVALALDVATGNSHEDFEASFMHKVYSTADSKLLLWIAFVVAAPLLEELFFRGLLYGGWVKTRLGFWGTALLTSAAWAAMHIQYDMAVIVMIGLIGVLLCLARRKTGSIYPCLAMHAAMNGLATIQTAYMQ